MKLQNTHKSKTHDDTIGCKRMIVFMIEQALHDIKQKRCSPSYLLDWEHAYNWIISDSFEFWCDMIDFDYMTIRKQVIREVQQSKTCK